MSQGWAIYQRNPPQRPAFGAWAAAPPPGQRTADFYSNWGTVGSTAAIIRDGNKWAGYEGNSLMAVVTSPAGGPSANALRTEYGTGGFDWVYGKGHWTQPGIGSSRWFRHYLLQNIADSGGAGSIDFGSAYAATHPIESEGDPTSISGNFYAWHVGSRPSGLFESYIDIDSITRQYTPGGAGGADPPLTLAKFTWWRYETQFDRTATSTYTMHLRIYDQSGVLQYSDADGKDNMYVWGGGKMSANTTGNTIDQAHIEELRFGINGGGAIAVGNRPQYVYYAGFATASDTWCGAYGQFIGET